MPNFNIIKKSKIDETFRVKKIISDFDLKVEHSNEKFNGEIKYPDNWQIGCIVGNSGTGKSTIAKELFKDNYIKGFEYTAKSVIDDMPKEYSTDEIEKMFYSCGFGSVPSWLKPYNVLSNGEKMRVDLARAILEKDIIVFDEFTSVVDRNVARTACIAINKAIKNTNKKIILISCHYDILDWLDLDWTFDTNIMKNIDIKKKREKKEYYIKRCKRTEWEKFRRYHYLDNSLGNQAQCYGLYDNENIIGFIGIIHFPHPKNKKIKKVTRLVILPDYQGIGLGVKFLNEIAKIYSKNYYFAITTSAKNLISALNKNENWYLTRCKKSEQSNSTHKINKSIRTVKTASFYYKNI